VNRRVALLALVIASGLTLPGCAHDDDGAPQTTTVEASYDDLLDQKNVSRQVSLAPGDTLRVVLASNASTGYQWAAEAQISDRGVLTQTSHQTVAPTDAKPGAAGTEVWTFDAIKPGSATLTTTYSQPWPGGAKDAWTFSAEVSVR
jgi:inhibitor of cysteine peptidase